MDYGRAVVVDGLGSVELRPSRSVIYDREAAHTIVVLEGRLEINGRVVGPGAYCHFPPGEVMRHSPAGGGGCLFVIVFSGPVDVEPLED